MSRSLLLFAAISSSLILARESQAQDPQPVARFGEEEAGVILEDAIELFRRGRFGSLLHLTDPFERFDSLIGEFALQYWRDQESIEALFNTGDEAFEAELDRVGGAGRHVPIASGRPATVQRVHEGERGGYDSASCRSCHFSGGADGAGTLTQVGLFRGDGVHLSSATLRDAPHIMGLGYLMRISREIEDYLDDERRFVLNNAAVLGEPLSTTLRYQGISFGRLTGHPDGTLDTSEVVGISPDLKIRVLGHKGRHTSLQELADEALQVHHGLISDSRVESFSDTEARFSEYLGDGPVWDPDEDSVSYEASEAQAVLMAGYMSLLGAPVIQPPRSPALTLIWAEGKQIFESVGCSGCHVTTMRMMSYETELAPVSAGDWSITLDLLADGMEPKPRNLDFGPDDNNIVPAGVPVMAFTDFKRHDMGPELADDVDEALPYGDGVVDRRLWVTRPLWGLADTAPYLHDGRASTVEEAIQMHGGEAEATRDAYLTLSEHERGALRVFLMSLTRPPSLFVE